MFGVRLGLVRRGTGDDGCSHLVIAHVAWSLVLVVALALAFMSTASSAQAEELSHAELEKLPEMTQWVYRNSSVKDPLSCNELCSSLWGAEQGTAARPNRAAVQEIWDELGFFETAEGLWPTLSEFSSEMNGSLEGVELGTHPFTIGWHVRGAIAKWMSLVQEGAPEANAKIFCGIEEPYRETLRAPGSEYGASPGPEGPEQGEPRPHTNAWTYVAQGPLCGGSVGRYQESELETCHSSLPHPPSWQEWINTTQIYARCQEGFLGKEPGRLVNEIAALRTRRFHFGLPEDYSAQTATDMVEEVEPKSAPGPEATEAALRAALENPFNATLNRWLRYLTTGEGSDPTQVFRPAEEFGEGNPGEPNRPYTCAGKPVNCATGNETESQTDLDVPGLGVPLMLTRTYNSQAAVTAGTPGLFGYGWTSTFGDHLEIDESAGTVTVDQANGSAVIFSGNLSTPGELFPPEWAQSKLTLKSDGTYLYTLPDQQTFHFNSSGRLLSEADRNGNTTTLSYNEAGRLETITDPAGRKMTLAYNSEGLVESAKDPMGHTVKYAYESGDLASVTEPGEASARWHYKYDGSHQLTEMIDGRGGKTINEYDGSHRVVSQKDPAGRELSFEYKGESEPFVTIVTNHATGAVTKESFDDSHELISIVHGYGTSTEDHAAFSYNGAGELTSQTNGDGYTTAYAYDSEGNRISATDPLGHEAKWTYDGAHDVLTVTTPRGETTTIKRDGHGNTEVIERPAPASKTQTTKYKYNSKGELESVTDPLERTWEYGYDGAGDRTSETDPAGDKRTWEYNEDSQETSTISPRGNVTGGEPTNFTTKIERDSQGRPLTITDPLKHTTKYKYDANGNVEKATDGDNHTTTYTYNGDDQPIKVEAPNKAVTETEYDGTGRVIGQSDGNKHLTKYVRNVLGEVIEAVDPLGRKTTKEYDEAGNLTSLTDPAKRTVTYTYDPANELTGVGYSDGKTPAVKYEYDADGDRTGMTDETGTTTYGYDQLDRLTESKDGHGDTTAYEYDLDNEQIKITYPNEKSVIRAFDKDGRLEKITDWNAKATTFSYNLDSELNLITFPSETKDKDKYTYNDADQMTEAKMLKSTETLASLVYKRDGIGQLTKTTSKELPGEENTAYGYDEDSRLTEAGATAYEYDAANNPTKTPGSTNSYNEANELEKGTGVSYTYNEIGERTKTSPSSGPATSYGYDQAGNLTSVTRSEEGETPKIEDSYSYNGDRLRASQTIGGTAHYLTWDMTGSLPLILNDGANSYIYGPNDLPVEQIDSEGHVLFLHHDQQGSTRMLTDTSGTVKATMTYDAYGNLTGHTGTSTTPLGYDGQYTDQDTGLIDLRAREYDPATAQFLSVDPAVSITRAPYNYAGDNPINSGDPTGLCDANPFSESFWTQGNCVSESPLNPIPYYEAEISSYENGCGYFASVAHGLEGAAVGALDVSGVGEEADAAKEATSVAGWGTLLNDIMEATGHHYLFIGTSIVATGAGAGFLIYEGGKLVYEAIR